MSWSLGNKKWAIPFKSLKGVNCHIDIYKRGYTGSTVTTLSPNVSGSPGCAAAQPFYWEEDDDENLLEVIRVKTGYINLVETIRDGLSDLYPSTNTEHFVEVTYGSSLVFTGFMQAQTFENDWAPAPRELSFPIISPLGIMEGFTFNTINPPTRVTFATLFREIISGSDGAYSYVQMQSTGGNPTTSINEFNSMNIQSLVVSPYKSKLPYGDTNPFEGQDYLYFIEAVCNAFGLIAHDEPSRLVFSKFDNSNNYYLTINSDGTVSVGTLSGNYDLDAEFENHSADNAESTVLPLNKITIDYEGEDVKDARLTYDYFSKAAGTILVSGWSMAKCTNRDGCLTSDQLISNPVINSDGRTSPSYGTAFIACGTDQLTEQILCQGPSYSPNNLFKWIVPDWCGRGGRIKFKVLSGWNIALGGDAGDPGLAVYLTCGSYNYNFSNNGWGPTSYAKQISGNGDFEISFAAPPIEYPLVMEVYCTSRLSSEVVISIQNLRIEANDSLVGAYLDISRDLKRVIQGTPSPEEGSIDATLGRAFSQYSNYVNGSGNIGQNPQYNYLKSAQNRLVISGALMSGGSPTALLSPYMKKTTFWKLGWKWKIIAVNFEPREDLWTLVLHHSTVND
jgi:hypothetical protein